MFNIRYLTVLLLAILIFRPAGPLAAQQLSSQANQGQIERSRLPNPTLPLGANPTSSGQLAETDDTASALAPTANGDGDLGTQELLNAPQRPKPLSLFADGGFVYTSNVALTNRNVQNDVFFVGEGGVGYDWTLKPDLTLSAAVRQQYFAYDRFDQLDFGALNAALGASYTLHRLDEVVISAQLGFTRLTHRGIADNEFFRAGNLELAAQKSLTINRAQVVTFGGDVNLEISVPQVAEREEFGLSVGYVIQISRALSVQTGMRLAYFLYADTGRQDFNGSGSTGLSYAFTPWCSVGATVSGTLDRSSRTVFDYEVFDSGASVFFRLRF